MGGGRRQARRDAGGLARVAGHVAEQLFWPVLLGAFIGVRRDRAAPH
jgi:hypothetical protein